MGHCYLYTFASLYISNFGCGQGPYFSSVEGI